MSEHLPAEAGIAQAELVSIQEQLPLPQGQTTNEGQRLLDRIRSKWTAVIAAGTAAIALVMSPLPKEQPAYASTDKYVEVGMPFDGKWGSAASGQANTHPIYGSTGQWAQDLFANGAEVKLNVSAPQGGSLSFKRVSNWTPNCKDADGKSVSGGEGIKVEVLLDGTSMGVVSYAHLDGVFKGANNEMSNGMVLGKTNEWKKSDCYQVNNDEGVHTHFEANSDSGNYACYYDRTVGSSAVGGVPIARLGKTSANGIQKACTETPGTGSGTTSPTGTEGNIGGSIASTRGAGRIDLFVQGTNTSGANAYRNLYGPSWQGWVTLENSGAGRIASTPATVSWGPDRIDVFSRGENNELVHKWYTSAMGWSPWESLDGCITGAPTVSSWGQERLDVFARGCNASGPNLYHKWYASGAWYGWEQVPDTTGTAMTSSPSAVSWGPGRIDLFAKGQNDHLLHKWYEQGWSSWEDFRGCIVGTPAVSSWAPQRLDAFMRACNTSGNNVWHKYYAGSSGWQAEWTPSGETMEVTNVLGAVSWGTNRIDVFGRIATGHIVHKWYEAGVWGNWEDLNGETPS